MEKFIPDMYKKSIYDIDYEALKNRGIKCIIFDLDNTIAPINVPVPDKELKDLISDLILLNFKVILMSNSDKARVQPFKEKLNIDSCYYSMKPLKKKYKKIVSIYGYKESEVACIGDQLLTDVYGANRMGFLSILINPISNIDYFGTKINRFFEKKIFAILEKKSLFKVGEYYD